MTKIITPPYLTSWDIIKKDVDNGNIYKYYVGSRIIETLKDGQEMTYALVDIDYIDGELTFVNTENYIRPVELLGYKDDSAKFDKDMKEYILSILPDDMVAAIAPAEHEWLEEYKLWRVTPKDKIAFADVLNDIPHQDIFNYFAQYGFSIRRQI